MSTPMRLFLLSKNKDFALEVLEYRPAEHWARVKTIEGNVVDDDKFYLPMLKRVYTLTSTVPPFWKD